MAAPTRLIPALREVLRFDETHVNGIDQLVLAHLIDSGELRMGSSSGLYRSGVDGALLGELGPRYSGEVASGGVHDATTRPLPVENTGSGDLVILKFFGPDITPCR